MTTGRRWPRAGVWTLLGVALLSVVAAPALMVPVYGDDFRLSQQMYAMFDGSLWNALTQSWNTGWQPNRFNPTGRFFAFNYHFLAHHLAVVSGISMHWFYRLGATILLILVVAAGAFMLRAALRFIHRDNSRIEFGPLFALISATLAVTNQLHPWSHDPLLTISEIGLGSAALGFLFLGLVIAALDAEPRRWRIVTIAILAAVGTAFYETFTVAIAVATLFAVWLFFRRRASRGGVAYPVVLGVAVFAIPVTVFILGRLYVSSMDLAPYSGTELTLDGRGLRVMSILGAGMVPGTAWPLSHHEGPMALSTPTVVGAIVLTMLLIGLALMLRSRVGRVQMTRRVWLVIGGVVIFVGATSAMHAFTEKYVKEITQVGQVYLSYTQLEVLCACVGAAVLLGLRFSRVTLAVVLLPIAVIMGAGQQVVNWTVADAAARDLALNRALSSLSVKPPADAAERCALLTEWNASHHWPAYYREAVVSGVNKDYEIAFGESFCAEPQ